MTLGKLWILALCGAVVGTAAPPDTKERVKRDFSYSAPIYYDRNPLNAPAPAPSQPQLQLPQLQLPQLQLPQLQLPQQGLQGLQGIPIIGALVGNIPGLNGLPSLANLGNLGNLGSFLNLGGLVPGVGLPQTQQQQCPLGQISRCRCQNLLQIPQSKEHESLEILQQNVKLNKNVQTEISARLSNGLQLHQVSGSEKLYSSNQPSSVVQGYYTIPIKDNKYLTIHYVVTDTDYTVKADVTTEPPKSDLDESPQLSASEETQ